MYSLISDIAGQISVLMVGSSPAITAFSWQMFNAIAVFQLVMICIRWQVEIFDNLHWTRFHLSDVIMFLMRVSVAGALLAFYTAGLPGFGISFHQLLPYLGRALAATVNQAGDAVVTNSLNAAVANMPTPSIFSIIEIGTYLGVLVIVSLFQMLMFVITAFGFIAVAVLSLTGPLVIPLLLTKNFARYFWSWVDQMVVYSMYPFISACFIFVLGNSLNNLFARVFAGGVTFAMLLIYLPVLLVMLGTFAFCVFRIPAFTSQHFGGAGSVFSSMAEGAESYVKGRLTLR